MILRWCHTIDQVLSVHRNNGIKNSAQFNYHFRTCWLNSTMVVYETNTKCMKQVNKQTNTTQY